MYKLNSGLPQVYLDKFRRTHRENYQPQPAKETKVDVVVSCVVVLYVIL